MVAGGYNVSVSLTMVDHVSKTLSKIEKNIQSTITAADDFAKATNLIAQNVGWWANNTEKLVTAMSNLKGVMRTMPTTWRIQPSKTNSGAMSPTTTNVATPNITSAKPMNPSPPLKGEIEIWKRQLNELKTITKQVGVEGANEMRKMGQEISTVAKNTVTTNNTLRNMRTLSSELWNRGYTTKASHSLDELIPKFARVRSAMTDTKILWSELWNHGYTTKASDALGNLKATLNSFTRPLQVVGDLKSDLGRVNRELVTMAKNTKFAQHPIQTLKSTAISLGKQGASAVNELVNALSKVANKADDANSSMGGLKSMLTRIGGAYLGLETVKTALNWSDAIILTEGKLAQLTDDVEGFMDKAYQMSQETRTNFTDNASQMAKMWQLTGGTEGIFETEDKLIEFNELLNKAFTLGGSGTREINASLYQLTQALSSGRLQGDELRSLSENAPYLINSIIGSIEDMYNAGKEQSEWIELTYNDLKKLGAEGVITSELVTDAVLNSADDIRKAFENITPTWEQTFTSLKNQVQKVSMPILKTLNSLINSRGFETIIQTIVKVFAIAMALLTPVLETVKAIGEFMADNWGVIEPILWGIVGALTAYYGIIMLAKTAVWLHTKALLFKEAVLKAMKTATILYQGALALTGMILGWLTGVEMVHAKALWASVGASLGMSAATWSMVGPILAVIAVLLGVVAVVYLVVYAYNKLTGATISATGIIVGAFYWMYAYVYNVIARMWNELVTFAEFLCNLFTHPQRAIADFGIAVIDILLAVNDAVMNIFGSMSDMIGGFVKEVGKAINWAVEGSNAVLGTNFQKVEWEDATDPWESTAKTLNTWRADIDAWGGKDRISLDQHRMDYKDPYEYYNKGYDKGVDLEKSLGQMFDTSKLLEGMGTNFDPDDYTSGVPGLEEYLGSLPNYDQPNVGGSTDLPDDIKKAIDGIKGNTDDITDMSEEELKYLRDIAEQKVINRFTTAEIKVTNNMNNNINSDRDIDGMADYFAQVIERACETTAERVNTTG